MFDLKLMAVLTSSMSAQSSTVLAIGPQWSTIGSRDNAPVYGTRPWVGFIPGNNIPLHPTRQEVYVR